MEQVKATKEIDGVKKSLAVDYEFGENIQSAIDLYGEEVVFSMYKKAAKIEIQRVVRDIIVEGGDDDAAQTAVDKHQLGISKPRAVGSVRDRAIAEFQKMSQEEQAAFLAELMPEAAEN